MKNTKRYIQTCLNELEKYTQKTNPFTRLVFSEEFIKARSWLKKEFKKLHLNINYDYAGNLFGVYKSKLKTNKKILIGSHLDTVKSGGRYDGIAGIVSSLAILKYFVENKINLPFDVELYDYLGEELNEWGTSCIGTRGMTGLLDKKILNRVNSDGKLLKDEIDRCGGNTSKLGKKFNFFKDVIACFELHIEQGVRLEQNKTDIGIVNSIPSISRHKLNIFGKASHSGTTLMNNRRDALVAASKLIIFINELAKKISNKDNRHFVATVGKIDVGPNAATIIPSEVELTIDLRVVSKTSRNEFLTKLNKEIKSLNTKFKIEFHEIAFSPYTEMDKKLNNLLKLSAKKENISFISLDSGAGHDTAHLSRVSPASMIFIPCKNGLSHCPEEYTKISDIIKGTQVIKRSIMELASNKKYY